MLSNPFTASSASSTARLSLLQLAHAAAGNGDYALASTYLFKAVMAKVRQEGYDIPFSSRSTRWIIFELERLRYPRLSLLQGFCAEFNYICYCLGTPDESRWNSFLRQGEFLLKNPLKSEEV